MIYYLSLGLLLLSQSYSFNTQDKITDKANIVEDDPSFPLHDTFRDTAVEEGRFTAGNTKCRWNHKCGFHNGTEYSWCYTNYHWGWEHCCAGPCSIVDVNSRFQCETGNGMIQCSPIRWRTVSNKTCISSYACGSHGTSEALHKSFFCYIDENRAIDFCCHPVDNCRDRKDGYGKWCYT
ncbi:hypothetical protein CHS0354_027773, partial [Potamilus streckersoni]